MSSPPPTTTVLIQLSGLPTPMFSTALLCMQNTDSLGLGNATRLQTKKLMYSRPRLSYVTRYTAGYPSHLLMFFSCCMTQGSTVHARQAHYHQTTVLYSSFSSNTISLWKSDQPYLPWAMFPFLKESWLSERQKSHLSSPFCFSGQIFTQPVVTL